MRENLPYLWSMTKSMNKAKGPTPKAASERFWHKVAVKGPADCWEWQAGKSRGYGTCFEHGMPVSAHRVSYAMHNGPIPPGMVVMHSCDNPGCVNPAHLSVGTQADNMADKTKKGRARPNRLANKSHCVHGHEMTVDNTDFNSNGGRVCKICYVAYHSVYDKNRRAKKAGRLCDIIDWRTLLP